ncbi:MAG: site-specific integrase [Solirubrobacterales bacterium]|nr:site-specific integrase [Solirubrobacterales bacterium]
MADGEHRDRSRPALSPTEITARAREDAQDAEVVRVAAYAGLGRGELAALRRRDVDSAGRKIIVRRGGELTIAFVKSARPVAELVTVGWQQ